MAGEGRVSLLAFLLGLSVVLLPSLVGGAWPAEGSRSLRNRLALTLALHVAAVNGLLLLLYRAQLYQIAVRACWLGFAFGCGLLLSFTQTAWKHFGCLEYTLAAVSSWVEFTIEKIIYPEMKQITWLSVIGLLMVLFGESLRKAAMLTAGSNFNHIIQNEKSESHILVKSGVYSWFRHPSYVGWFYWSIGTQILLCNPVCVVGYTLASWRFFRERIEEEEFTLILFFGEQYLDYKRKVPSGLPFISGAKVEL
uniref:Protein-S-isoprenylcysteine O-methyltransferase n=1 Tax=Geotrypetes seraphini TaxID=260995 RepID=A0A6P8P4Y4_GEOSA|nr:protein-S-isoprenylcysteine O-methyltransferase isoform X2 [Geotrypetes seraphini]